MVGIYVHNTKAEPYADQIISGEKTIETRNLDVLKQFVGQQVAIVRTASGKKAEVIGYVTITGKKKCTAEELDGMRDQTKIPIGSKYDITGGTKWCYFLKDPHPTQPYTISSYLLKTRSWISY